ncbi:MAG: PorP/SprF family type IX secretion system membrane protein [Ferruginibacter sp.]
MRKYFLFVIVVLSSVTLQAQDPHFSQFFASPLTLNPAFTGKFDGIWRLAANHRDQWPSIPKAYVTTSASVDFAILKKKIPEGDVFGVGISGLTDASANNALKLNYGSVSLSYHKALDENGYNTIGAGFQGTYSSMALDITKLTFEDELQQNGFAQGTSGEYIGANPLTGRNRNYFEMNAGLLYSGSSNGENNYYLGASMYHINRPKVSFKDKSWYLTGRLTIHGGGSFPISDVVGVNISAIHQIQNKASETVFGGAVSLNANGDNTNPTNVYVGSWMRLNDAIIPYIGLEIGGLRIGASYDVNISDLKAATGNRGGSEISVIYIKRPQESKGIPCPRF